jgi:hypothetical protein
MTQSKRDAQPHRHRVHDDPMEAGIADAIGKAHER